MAKDNVIPLRPPRPCPICGKPSVQAFHPFCSARCADIDLNRWLSGSYVIPGDDEPADEAPAGGADRPGSEENEESD
jgi:endogenous inhibitor of DNA gyrase (YacG/DUF329 family)